MLNYLKETFERVATLSKSDHDDIPPVENYLMFGVLIMVFFVGGFVIWSTFAELDTATVAQGKVTVQGNRKTIQHLEGGIVKQLHVKEGSQIKKNDLLVTLEDTQAKARVNMLVGRMHELLSTEVRLQAELSGKEKIVWPEKLLNQKNDVKLKKILEGQTKLFRSNKESLAGRLEILNQRVRQLEKEIASIQAQVQSDETQLKLIGEEVRAVEFLEKRKLIDKPRLLALKREQARLQGDRGESLGLIARAKQRIGETKQQIIANIDAARNENLKQLRETQSNLAEALERSESAKDVLLRTKIVAPIAGTVVGLKMHTIGGIIAPGDTILEIVPSKEELIIEAKISPLDIDIVNPGLPAKVQLIAFKQRHVPSLNGKVIHVSADSFQDPQTQESHYLARVKLNGGELERAKMKLSLYPGMPVQVLILVDKRSLLRYLIDPLRETFGRAFHEQ